MRSSPVTSETGPRRSCRRWHFSSVVLAALVLCQSLSRAQETEAWQPPGVVASFSFKNDGSMITVPVTIDGTERTFLLDTGSALTILDTTIVGSLRKHRETVRIATLGSMVSLPLYDCPELCAQDWKCSDLSTILSTDLRFAERALNRKVEGILGMDALKGVALHIDFDRGKLLLLDSSRMGKPPGKSIPMTLGPNGTPYLSGRLPDIPYAVFLIDTGKDSTGSICQPDFTSLRSAGHVKSTGVEVAGLVGDGTITNNEAGYCVRFSLADFTYNNLVFTSGRSNALGLRFLRRHRLTFDFPRETAYIEPGRCSALRDRGDYCGLIFDADMIVQQIDPKSLGEKAGLELHDRLVSIDGKLVQELKWIELQRMLALARESDLVLTVRRGDQFVKITIEGG